MSDRKYAVEMPIIYRAYGLAPQTTVCSMQNVLAMRDKMQDAIDQLEREILEAWHAFGLDFNGGVFKGDALPADRAELKTEAAHVRSLLIEARRELRECKSELAVEREKTAKLASDLEAAHSSLFTQQDIDEAYANGRLNLMKELSNNPISVETAVDSLLSRIFKPDN